MSFQESSETIQSRLHLGNVRPVWLIVLLAGIAVVAALALNAVVDLVSGHSFSVEKASEPSALNASADEATLSSTGEEVAEEPVPIVQICVHVSGCVVNEGVYYLDEGSRVHEAIRAAGGLSAEAAEGYVNKARLLVDGEQIYIPSRQDVEQAQSGGASALWGAESPVSADEPQLVNINTATNEELQSLKGIGEVTAQNIIDDREQNGPFSSIEDIKRVSGIGDKKFEAIAESICV